MMTTLRRVSVFCGSRSGVRREYAQAAEDLGRELARRRIGLVYGGSRFGLMGAVAGAAISAGAAVVGISSDPKAHEFSPPQLSDLRVVATMHERKALMASISDAFIALPGGFGTLEEFCEMLTWTQIGHHRKPCGLLNVAGYYDPLLGVFDKIASEGFVSSTHRNLVIASDDPALLISRLDSASVEMART